MAACGSGSSSHSNVDPPASGSLSGNWQMTLQPSNTKSTRTQSGFLLDNNGTLTGSVLLTDYPCSGIGSVTGTLDGTDVTLVTDPVGITVNMTGTTGSPGAMSGTYTMLADGCTTKGASPESGTWTATLVAPLTGNITGSFNSHSGSTFPVTANISQGQNSGASNAALTGTVTVPDPCVLQNGNTTDTLTVNGLISGTAVVINLNLPDSTTGTMTQAGQITGTLDGTAISGKYEILPPQPSVKGPCHGGDHGTVTLTLQQ